MRKSIKIIMVCVVLTAAGFILAAAGVFFGGEVYGLQINSDGIQVSAPLLDEKKEKNVCRKAEETLDAFDAVQLEGEYENVRIKIEAQDSDDYALSYCLRQDRPLYKEIKGGKLILKNENKKTLGIKNVNFTWFSVGRDSYEEQIEEYVTIRVPKEAKLKSAEIKTDSGETACENIQADLLKIESDYGNADLLNVRSKEMQIQLDCGDLNMENVQADKCTVQDEYGNASFRQVSFTGGMDIDMDSGNAVCENSSFGVLNVTSSYGNADIMECKSGSVQMMMDSGNIMCQDSFMDSLHVISDFGNLDVRRCGLGNVQMSLESGECRMKEVLMDSCAIDSEYGSVSLALEKPVSDYAYRLAAEYGTVKIEGKDMGSSYASLEGDESGKNQIEIICRSGDIVIQ